MTHEMTVLCEMRLRTDQIATPMLSWSRARSCTAALNTNNTLQDSRQICDLHPRLLLLGSQTQTDAITSLSAARRTLLAQPVAVLLVLPAAAQATAPQAAGRANLPLRAAHAQRRSGTTSGTREVLGAAAAQLWLHLVREGRDGGQTPRLLLLLQSAHSKIKTGIWHENWREV